MQGFSQLRVVVNADVGVHFSVDHGPELVTVDVGVRCRWWVNLRLLSGMPSRVLDFTGIRHSGDTLLRKCDGESAHSARFRIDEPAA